jgi:hypothetical protein
MGIGDIRKDDTVNQKNFDHNNKFPVKIFDF